MTSIGEMLGSIRESNINFAVRYIKRLVRNIICPMWFISHALEEGKNSKSRFQGRGSDAIVHINIQEAWSLQGAMLTNANLVSKYANSHMDAKLSRRKSTLSPLPVVSYFAFSVNCLAMFELWFIRY
ncbi:MAG: hypothetical protein IPN46_14605 [Saprospiraceae bacterium]|nr:hypothetical protein [Saprospiraceae bacterium]